MERDYESMPELQWIDEFAEEVKTGKPLLADWRKFLDSEFFDKEDIPKIKNGAKNEDDMFFTANALGNLYYRGEDVGVSPNYEKAVFWFSRAAQYSTVYRGVVLMKLTACYRFGRGKNKNLEKYFKMLKKLSQIDDSNIITFANDEDDCADTDMCEFTMETNLYLGECYQKGKGTDKDEKKALAIWEKYAERSDIACRKLGCIYFAGKLLPKDYAKAVSFWKEAADGNDECALNNLGMCLENGFGIEKNIGEAIACYKKSAELGSLTAKNNLKRLKKKGIIIENEDD